MKLNKKFGVLLVLMITVVMSTISFAGTTPSSWAQPAIDIANARNAIGSRLYSDYQANITRGDFAYLAVRAYEELTGRTATLGDATFTDTKDGFVLKAKNLGIVGGYPDGSYKPNNPIIREELASLMVNLMKVSGLNFVNSTSGKAFSDVPFGNWAYENVMIAKNNAIVKGTNETLNLYSPKGNATREAAIAMYVNLVQTFDEYTGYVDWTLNVNSDLDALNSKLGVPAGFTVDELNATLGIYVPKATNGLYSAVSAKEWKATEAVGLHFQIVLKNKDTLRNFQTFNIVREWTKTDWDNTIKAIKQPKLALTDFRESDILEYITYSETHKMANGTLGDFDTEGYLQRFLVYDKGVVTVAMNPENQTFLIEVYTINDLKRGTLVMTGGGQYDMYTLDDILNTPVTIDYRSR